MEIRFWIDPATDRPHANSHGVTEEEVEEVLSHPLEDRPGSDGARIALGRTRDGRFLRVVYVPDAPGEGIFVVTAYDLGRRAVWALRRRLRRRR